MMSDETVPAKQSDGNVANAADELTGDVAMRSAVML